MKKIILIQTAVLLAISAVSCGKSSNTDREPVQEFTAEKLSIASYKKEDIGLPDDMNFVYSFMTYNGGEDRLLLGTSTRTPEFWHTNADISESEVVEFQEFDIGVNYNVDTANDGTLVCFVIHADYGDLPPVELYSFPEGYDEEIYDNAAEYSFRINTFSAEGELLTSEEVEGFPVIPDKSTAFDGVYTDGSIVVVKINGGYETFRTDGEYLGELTSDKGDISAIGHDKEGKLLCAVRYEEDEKKKLELFAVGGDGKPTETIGGKYELAEVVQELMPGSGNYSVFLRTAASVYGIRSDSSGIEYLLDMRSAGLNANELLGFMIADDGKMAVMSADYAKYCVNYKKYVPRTQEELAGLPVVTVGMLYESGELLDQMNRWNDEGHEFLVEAKIYGNNSEKFETVIDDLTRDILSGELPDILEVNRGYIGYINMMEKGALCDLYEFMDKEPYYNREHFLPDVLRCCEYQGKLCYLPDGFDINLGIIGKTKFLGSADDWSRSKLVDMVVDPPIEVERQVETKMARFYNGYVDYDDWMNYDEGTCDFTNADFIRLLEWSNEPEELEREYSEFPPEISNEEAAAAYERQQCKYIDDLEILGHEFISRYTDYIIMTKGEFGGEELTFVEAPEMYASYCSLAISANSAQKELAWEFIKNGITDERYSSKLEESRYVYDFPVTVTALEMTAEWEKTQKWDNSYMETDDLKNYDGYIYEIPNGKKRGGIKIGNPTDEDIAAVNEMFKKMQPAEKVRPYDEKLDSIIEEETERYFNGDGTAKDCADRLQDRLSIYMSEQYG